MAILFCSKVFDGLADNINNTFYSLPEFNATLGKAEKYFFQVRPSQVGGGASTLTLTLETSNDNVNWNLRSTLLNQTSITTATQALFASELGTAQVGACFARVGIRLGGASAVAFVEVWATGRNAA